MTGLNERRFRRTHGGVVRRGRLQSAAFSRRKRRRAVAMAAAAAFSCALAVFAVSELASLSGLQIRSVAVSGLDASSSAIVRAAAEQAISGTYMRFFPKSNVWIFPREAVTAAVESALPRVGSAVLSVGVGGILRVDVTARTPVAMVCGGLPSFGPDGYAEPPTGCYEADADGFLFEAVEASSTSTAGGQTVIYDPFLPADPIGSMATSSAEFRGLTAFAAGAASAGLPVEGVLMKPDGEYELYARNPGSGTVVLYFDDAGGLPDELADLEAFWTYMVTDAPAGQKPDFDYIKLQYGRSVPYRLSTKQ